MTLRTAALLAALLAPAAAAQSLLDRVEPTVTTFTLDNGLTFVVARRPDAPVVTFYTYADVGSVDEPAGQTGIAHVFEHMAFKGTTTLGTRDLPAELAALDAEDAAFLALRDARRRGVPAAEIARLDSAFVAHRDSAKALAETAAFDTILSRHGAVGMNASTSADRTDYFYSLPANRLELWFNTESDRFLNPVQREFYQERDVVMEERRMRTESNPIGRLVEEFLAAAFKAHPYGWPTVGHMSDLQALSRDDAEVFFARYYGLSNLTIAIVGDVDPVEVRALADRYFGPAPRVPRPEGVRTVEPPQAGERRVTVEDRAQPVALVGYHRPAASHPDHAAYGVLEDVLAGGRTGRLYRALVEARLAVYADAFSGFPGEKYPHLLALYLVPAPGVSTDSLEAAAYRVLDEVATGGITPEELARAQARARSGLVGAMESSTGLARVLARAQALRGDWRAAFRDLDAVSAVTAADVQRVAAATFRPSNRTVAVLRPPSDL